MSNDHTNAYRLLEELRSSDFETVSGEPDITGWKIKDNLGAELGKVEDLLFNPESRKVRYLIAALNERVFGVQNRRILIPIGLAELHETQDEVFLPSADLDQLMNAPEYTGPELSIHQEVAARDAFRHLTEDSGEVYDERTFYEHDHYNQRNLYGRRFNSEE